MFSSNVFEFPGFLVKQTLRRRTRPRNLIGRAMTVPRGMVYKLEICRYVPKVDWGIFRDTARMCPLRFEHLGTLDGRDERALGGYV
jgi:hypothetical protein